MLTPNPYQNLFVSCTQEQYDALVKREQINDDTLYFTEENNNENKPEEN